MNDIRDMIASASNSRERKILLNEFRRAFKKENDKFPTTGLVEIPINSKLDPSQLPIKAFRSREFLVQIYDIDGMIRISVNRTAINDDGTWVEGISWDSLQKIKSMVGYGDKEAVEVFPKDKDVVNVANIRHLFIMETELPFIWRKRN
jgi:hypothetical protein